MIHRFCRVLGACVVLARFVLPGETLPSEGTVLTLDDAISLALASHPDIRGSEKDIERARGLTLQLDASPNPELVFSNEGIPFRAGGPEREFSLGLRQSLEFPGKRGLRKAVGLAGERVSQANVESVRRQIIVRVKRAYFQAAYSEMAVAHLQSILEMLKEYQKLAAIRFQAGEVTSTDVLRGRLEEVRVRNDIIEAGRTLQRDRSALWLEMGAEAPDAFPSLSPLAFAPIARALEDIKKEAEDIPSIRALREELGLRDASLRLARKAAFPDLRLGLFYPSLKASGWGFEVEVSLPLWRRPQRGRVLEAEALREQGRISLAAALRRTLIRVESAYNDVRASSDQLTLIESSLLGDASDLLAAGVTNYQYGRIGSLDLFDIYRLNRESRLEYLRALLSFHLALVDLEAAGQAPEA